MIIINKDQNIEKKLYVIAGITTMMLIASFSLYNTIVGNTIIAIIDLSVFIIFSFSLRQILINQFTFHLKLISVLLCTISVLSIIYINKNTASIYWVYPLVTGIYFLFSSRLALAINIFIIIISVAIVSLYVPMMMMINSLASLILVSISSYIFSKRTEVYHNKLTNLVDIDPLTKLNNRHSLNNELANEIALAKSNIHTSSLIILDLDHFKKINDAHGHTVGDATLVSFASMLKRTVRETDKVYRYGGEEFIIIANNTKLENAGKLAEQLRIMTENTIIVEDHQPVTVSIGVAEVKKDDTNTSWLHRADYALYKAKKFSRNTVFLAYNDLCFDQYKRASYKNHSLENCYEKQNSMETF